MEPGSFCLCAIGRLKSCAACLEGVVATIFGVIPPLLQRTTRTFEAALLTRGLRDFITSDPASPPTTWPAKPKLWGFPKIFEDLFQKQPGVGS